MKIRAFDLDDDFDGIKTWITDERTHMMWCANLIPYPLEKEKMTVDTLRQLFKQNAAESLDNDRMLLQ